MTLTLIFKATLILTAAAAASRLLRGGSAAQRHLVWTLAFLALLALPFVPRWSPPVSGALAAMVSSASRGSLGAAPVVWWRWLWMAGALAALFRLAVAHWRMANTSEVQMAMTWGVLRPRIMAPPEGLPLLDRQHEEAHVARRDGLWQFVAQLACAAYWFHPLVWWAERRAAQERECACDDVVLGSGADPADYAQRLVDAARVLAAPPIAVLAVSGESGLAARVKAILDPAIDRRGLRWRDLACGLALAGAMLAPLAPVAAQQPESDADVKPKLVYKIEPEYSDEARAAAIEGPGHLTAVVNSDGSFTDVKVVSGIGYGLDEKAIEAIEQWRAEQAKKDGKPVDSTAQIIVNFRLGLDN